MTFMFYNNKVSYLLAGFTMKKPIFTVTCTWLISQLHTTWLIKENLA